MHRVPFASFLSGGFITAILVNPPEKKPAKATSDNDRRFRLKLRWPLPKAKQ